MTGPGLTAALLTARINREQASRRIPSLSAAWARDGQLQWHHAVGSVDGQATGEAATPATQYRIGSITKTFVAVLVMTLVAEQQLSLDDPLERHLPGTPIGQVTIGQLLSQSSGLRAETAGPWWERTPGGDLAGLVEQLALREPAIGRFHYSNVGFAVLAAVVEKLRGAAWAHCLHTQILAPLGMSRTTLRPAAGHAIGLAVHPYGDLTLIEPEHDAGAMAPAGQLWSTTTDLAIFARFLQHGDERILPSRELALMKRPHSWDDTPGQPWTRAYGLGLDVINTAGQRIYGHGGSMPGFLAGLRFRDDGDVIILLANTTAGLSAELTGDLFGLIDTHAQKVPAVWHADPAQHSLLDLSGEWFWGPARFTISMLSDGWLELAPVNAGRGSRFRPVGQDQWEGQSGYYLGEPLQVIRESGRPAYLDLASFRFSRKPYDSDADIPGGVDLADWH